MGNHIERSLAASFVTVFVVFLLMVGAIVVFSDSEPQQGDRMELRK